jgi:dsDNA-binding SOS-regulon protein
MALSIPRYPEFDLLNHWSEKEQFYIPELEMVFGEVCSAMKKSWRGYKWARREGDTELQEHYADIIQGITEALGYDKMVFRIVENFDVYASMEDLDPELITVDQTAREVDQIDEMVDKERLRKRAMAIAYGKTVKPYNWDKITKQYVTYITPEDADDQDYMLEMNDEINEVN